MCLPVREVEHGIEQELPQGMSLRSRHGEAYPDSVWQALEKLAVKRGEYRHELPRILILVAATEDYELLKETLRRIPVEVAEMVEEITIFDVLPEEEVARRMRHPLAPHVRDKLRFYRNPTRYGYGDNLKNCFDYAVLKGFDHVAVLRGDGAYDPSYLAIFLAALLEANSGAILGRRVSVRGARSSTLSSTSKRFANRLLSRVEDLLLGMGIEDYHCGFRLLSTEILRRIPYHLNSGDYLFDLEMLIQIRCLGIPISTVSVPDFHDEGMRVGTMCSYAIRAVGTALGYRLHQLHLIRRGTYFVDLGERYVLKRNRYSSHMKILKAIEPGSHVLDLGCGQSLLAEEYHRRGITVVGVDKIPPDKVSPFVKDYVRHDMESPLDLKYGRVFDYVVLSDVIEHISDRESVMRSLRRYLKADGRLIASTGNVAIWFYRVSLLIGRFEYGPRGILDRTHVHLFTFDSFKRFLKQQGYRVLRREYTPIPFELVFESTGRSRTVERITRWYYYLARAWPTMFAYQFIMHCTFSSYEAALGEEMWSPDRSNGGYDQNRQAEQGTRSASVEPVRDASTGEATRTDDDARR